MGATPEQRAAYAARRSRIRALRASIAGKPLEEVIQMGDEAITAYELNLKNQKSVLKRLEKLQKEVDDAGKSVLERGKAFRGLRDPGNIAHDNTKARLEQG